MDAKVEEYLKQTIESDRELVDSNYSVFTDTDEFDAMTPIEQMLLIALLGCLGFLKYDISPQYKIGDKRVDFLIRDTNGQSSVIIECDGHDFHEKTKKQATSDKRRDRELKMLGHTVLRFTGSEIWNNPMSCATEVWAFLTKDSNG